MSALGTAAKSQGRAAAQCRLNSTRWPRPAPWSALRWKRSTRPRVTGASSLSLDEIAESVIREAGAIPSFLGYHGYPASICASVNDRVVHGIPSAAEVLAPGDLVSIDCGAVLDWLAR